MKRAVSSSDIARDKRSARTTWKTWFGANTSLLIAIVLPPVFAWAFVILGAALYVQTATEIKRQMRMRGESSLTDRWLAWAVMSGPSLPFVWPSWRRAHPLEQSTNQR
jgi:hypothetical protein